MLNNFTFLSEQCVSHVPSPFPLALMEKFSQWIWTPPTAAVHSTTVVCFCIWKRKKKFPFLSVCSKPKLQCFAVCDVNLCPESSVSCAAGLSLVQTHVPGLCCPQYHCGTHTQTDTYQYTTFNSWCFIFLYNFFLFFFTVFVKYRMQVWGWLSLKLSSGKKAKINNTTH